MDNLKVSKETICTTIFCFLGVINFFLDKYGIYPIEIQQDVIFDAVSAIWAVVGVLTAWWKNQSFTKAAIIGDKVKDAVKSINPVDYKELEVEIQKVEAEEKEELEKDNTPEVE